MTAPLPPDPPAVPPARSAARPLGAAPDPRIGTRLGKYVITGVLGKGGMGVVYEARDPVIDRRVAIKVLPESLSADPAALRRFLTEARAAGKLEHPNAVAVYDADRCGDAAFIAMQLVRGGSAAERLRSHGPFPWPEATRLIRQAARGVAAAHAVGMIHRDLKPGNLLIAHDGAVKIADFGLAKLMDLAGGESNSTDGLVSGTPQYMSPEQCRGERLDLRTDLYSLGACYFALLTGRPPYVADTPMEVLAAHCRRPVPDPREIRPDVPEAVAAVVRRAMAKDRDARYQNAADLIADLDRLPGDVAARGGAGVTAPIPGAAASVAPRVPSRWRRAAGAAALLIAGAAIGALAVPGGWITGEPAPPRDDPPADVPEAKSSDGPPRGPTEFAAHTGPVRFVAVSADGRLAVSLARTRESAGEVRLWHPEDLSERRGPVFGGGDRMAVSAAFAPDGRLLATGHSDGTVRLWDLDAGRERSAHRMHTTAVSHVAWTADGRIASLAGGTLKIWKPGTPRDRETGYDSRGVGRPLLAFGPGARTALSAGGRGDTELRWWDLAEGRQTASRRLPVKSVIAVAAAPDGRTTAAACHPAGVLLWDPAGPDRALRAVPTAAGGVFRAVAFSPDSTRLAGAGDDRTVRVWAVADGRELAAFEVPAPVHALAFASDGRLLLAACEDRTVRVRPVPPAPR